jgi:hypothetical protein
MDEGLPGRTEEARIVDGYVVEWRGHRYRLAESKCRSLPGAVGWTLLVPVAVAADVILLPVYLGYAVAVALS